MPVMHGHVIWCLSYISYEHKCIMFAMVACPSVLMLITHCVWMK